MLEKTFFSSEDSKDKMLYSFNYTDSGCDITDVGRQFECHSASL